ncbi:MAG: SEC-C metal-binding domain-containing protein [Blastocatellia bacterium]|jgi:hypothetical protein
MTVEGTTLRYDDRLVERLLQLGDRLTVEDLEDIRQAGDSILPILIQVVRDEDAWYEGQGDQYWLVFHAVTLLSLSRNPQVLPDLIDGILPSYFAEYDWLHGHWPTLLAQMGPAAVEPLIEWIGGLRGAWIDSPDSSEARAEAATALALIAHEDPSQRAAILRLFQSWLNDEGETDLGFLSAIVPPLLYLDWSSSLPVVEKAYRAGRVLPERVGSWREVGDYRDPQAKADFFRRDLLWFYRPREIARRQALWKRPDLHARLEALREQGDPRIGSAPVPPSLAHFYRAPAKAVSLSPASHAGKTGRNDPCPCQSGKKYKKCCGQVRS